jgi:hypothetical protein
MLAFCSPRVLWGKHRVQAGSCGSLRGAGFLYLLGFCSSGRFLDHGSVCVLSLFALAFQAQFDKVLPKRVVVHDSSLQREELLHGPGVLLGSPQNRKTIHGGEPADGRRVERQH